MDVTCKIQESIHAIHLTYKYVPRILGTYHDDAALIPDFKAVKREYQKALDKKDTIKLVIYL